MDSPIDEWAVSRLLSSDLYLNNVGDVSNWLATMSQPPATRPSMMLVDLDLIPEEPSNVLICL
ncbi:MAG: hypothetical protein JW704_04155 [Anaerolineaceae bacterium]|nr:hypothetical protein [Anaerolineaceae bacterium]MBN2677455.1 hypothetical protein [Anaerolineaceae bacterium]